MNDVTHLGIYDIPMISNIPNLVYLAPVTVEEYRAMLDWALDQTEHPVASVCRHSMFPTARL